MKQLISLLSAAALCLSGALLWPTTSFASQSQIDQTEFAYQLRDDAALAALQTEALSYEQALNAYRLAMVYYYGQNKQDEGIQTLKRARSILEAITTQTPDEPEAMALLSGVYGIQIHMQPESFMTLGYKSSKLIGKAMALAPDNPRVQLFYGINRFHAPTMFGGGEQKALHAFEKSIDLFERGKGTNYQWGEADAYIWRGLAQQQLGLADAAAQSWHKALEIAPDSRYAKQLLAQNRDS